MAHLTTSTEYALHCLLWLVGAERAMSARELAELQGVSPSFLAKIFPKLERAGIVAATEGVRGGYRLARWPEEISFLDVVDAIEGDKPIFECQEVRGRCAVFAGKPPGWATGGVCAVHAVMLQAEKAMRAALAARTLGDVAEKFGRTAPASFFSDVRDWIDDAAPDRRRKPARDGPS